MIDRTLSGTTSLGKSGPGSNGYEGVLHIPQSFSTGAHQVQFSVIFRTLNLFDISMRP